MVQVSGSEDEMVGTLVQCGYPRRLDIARLLRSVDIHRLALILKPFQNDGEVNNNLVEADEDT